QTPGNWAGTPAGGSWRHARRRLGGLPAHKRWRQQEQQAMAETSFTDLLNRHIAERRYKPAQLAQLTGIARDTIVNWCDGTSHRPRQWTDVVKLATALRLPPQDADELLAAAGHLALDDLRATADPREHAVL